MLEKYLFVNTWYESKKAYIYVVGEDNKKLYYSIRINDYTSGPEISFDSFITKYNGELMDYNGELMDYWKPLENKRGAIKLLFRCIVK